MHSLNVDLEPGKTVHVTLVKARYITQEFDYTVPSAAATVTKTMIAETGTLAVTTTPPGASVAIYRYGIGPCSVPAYRGAYIGTYTSPFTKSLPPGHYCVIITKSGYEDIVASPTISVGVTRTLTYTLVPAKGTLSVTTTPTGASVKVGTDTKTSPCIFTLAAGAYTVTISKVGYGTITDSVAITAGETTTKSYTLTPSKVTITFDTKKEDGTALTGVGVWVDGVKRGVT